MKRIEFVIWKLSEKKGELGIGIIISIAITIIVAGFILVPGLRAFADSVMSSMTIWWNGTIKSGIFPAS